LAWQRAVNLITTKHAVSANIKAITAEDEMQKKLVDIIT
jgi:flagellar hook protein FlgE